MKKKLCAILLALCLPLTLLTGCGGNGAADGFLDTLKEAKNQKDYQLELISAEDETWETGKKLTGTVSRSNSQADLTLTAFGKGDKTLGTVKILVDGKDIYLKLDDWITYLNQQFKDMTTDSEDYADDIQTLQEVAQKLDGKYVKLSVSEDTFTLWEKSEGASGAFSKWYNGLGKALKNSVTEKDGLYTLSLDAKGLETVKVDWLTQLTENQEAYCDLLSLLLASVEDTLAMAGWNSKDYLDNIWSEYQEDLTALKENGIEKGAALEMTAEKGKDGVYALSAVEQGETQRYLKATVTPLAQVPEQWTAPKDWQKESDLAEQLADLYLSNQTVSAANNTTQTEEEIPAEFDWDKRYQEEGDDTRDYGTDLKLSELKGYIHLKAMKMDTEDNKKVTLPMVPGAEYAEADNGDNDLPYSVYQSASGWEGNVYDIELGRPGAVGDLEGERGHLCGHLPERVGVQDPPKGHPGGVQREGHCLRRRFCLSGPGTELPGDLDQCGHPGEGQSVRGGVRVLHLRRQRQQGDSQRHGGAVPVLPAETAADGEDRINKT